LYEFTNREYWERYFKEFRCPDCGGTEGFCSRPRTFSEKYILPVFMLRPVRCGDCFRRLYRPVTVPVRERIHSAPKAPQVQTASHPHVRDRVA
jgi:hypothetical protein